MNDTPNCGMWHRLLAMVNELIDAAYFEENSKREGLRALLLILLSDWFKGEISGRGSGGVTLSKRAIEQLGNDMPNCGMWRRLVDKVDKCFDETANVQYDGLRVPLIKLLNEWTLEEIVAQDFKNLQSFEVEFWMLQLRRLRDQEQEIAQIKQNRVEQPQTLSRTDNLPRKS